MPRTSSSLELLVALHRGGPSLHVQLEGQLREAIRDGRLAPGTRLPSSRALAAELGVSRGVVVEAYAQLAAEGYLRVRPGAAPVVGDVPTGGGAAPPTQPDAVPRHDLRPGLPDLSTFPRAAWGRALRHALREIPDAELGYPDPAGHPRLRAALAAYLGRVRGVRATPDRIVVCGGVAEALRLTASVLRDHGATTVAVEDPSHAETQGQLAFGGLEPVPVAVDELGLDVAAIPPGASAALVTPAHHFPSGVVLAPERRAALVAWARDTGGLIIEDDYDAEHRYDRAPVGAVQGLAPDHVVHVHSVSKTLAPGLRLGWAVAPAPLAGALAEAKRRTDLGTPVLEQLALADLIERGELDRHLRRVRTRYRRRRDALVAMLLAGRDDLAVEGVAAGLHVAVRLPPHVTEEAAVAAAAARGIAVATVGEHAVAPRPAALVLGYTRLPEPGLRAAARALLAAIADAAPAGMDAVPRTCDNRHQSSDEGSPMESSEATARVLVVANRTAATPGLIEAVRERAARGPASFTLLVPSSAHGLHQLVDPEDQGRSEAEETIELALPLLERAAGAPVEPMIGVHEPLAAIQDAVNLHGFDELIISTLPKRVSRWLKLDLPHKAAGLGLPVTTVTAQGIERIEAHA